MSWLVISRQAVERLASREAGAVQLQRQLAQLLAGELARAREHGDQRRNGVAAALDEVGELLQVVLRLLGLAVAALGAEQLSS